eukprot:3900010-Prymnesium_polylepis.1
MYVRAAAAGGPGQRQMSICIALSRRVQSVVPIDCLSSRRVAKACRRRAGRFTSVRIRRRGPDHLVALARDAIPAPPGVQQHVRIVQPGTHTSIMPLSRTKSLHCRRSACPCARARA